MTTHAAKTWFITGCSTGLGRAMAAQLLESGDNLVLTARDPSVLADLVVCHEDRVIALALDVTDAAAIERAVDEAEARFGAVDILVNNAGYGHLGTVEEVAIDHVYRLFETNLFGVIRLIKRVIPSMRARRSGQIVNIASVGGLFGYPGSAYYCATKFGLVGLTEALQIEVETLGIKVTVVEPGPFDTDFSKRSLAFTAPASADYDLADGFARAGAADWATTGADPERGAAAILAAVRSDTPPVHFVVGDAGIEAVVNRSEKRSAEFAQWREAGRC